MPVRVLSSPRSRSWVRRILRRFRNRGTLPAGGYLKPSAYTRWKVPGTTTPATGTWADTKCSPELGSVWAAQWLRSRGLPDTPAVASTRRRVSRLLGHGSYTYETDIRGASGQRLGRADFTNRGDETT